VSEKSSSTNYEQKFQDGMRGDKSIFPLAMLLAGNHSGLMISALNSRSSGPHSSPGQGYCVVFLGKTQCLSPPRCIDGYAGG